MRLIGLAVALTLSLVLAPVGVTAQPTRSVPTIGFLGPSPLAGDLVQAFQEGLRDLGYVEGQNIRIEYRYTDAALLGHTPSLPRLAAELVQHKPDVLVVSVTEAALAAKNATNTIPIVMVSVSDPLAAGLVTSLARPGGNVSGLSMSSPELSGKRLELLKEVVSRLSRVAFLWNPEVRGAVLDYNQTEGAARSLGLQLESVEAVRAEDLDRAFSAMTEQRAQALIVASPNPVTFTNRGRIASFAQRNRLPSMYGNRDYVDAGGLMSYGPSAADLYRRAATYVDKILKGTKPADLPVEQPTKFELVINLKTAKALGLTIPQSVLLRADQVIE
jgi:putative tryptophan/tyrosine transport system substrate-binding protein